MNKEKLLKSVSEFAQKKLINKKELDEAFYSTTSNKASKDDKRVVKSLYYVGGCIIVLGIFILIIQHWRELNSITKILATLGSGIAAYLVAMSFGVYEKLKEVSMTFYLISALVLPIGLSTTFDIAGFDMGSYGTYSIISLILFIIFILSYFFDRNNKILFSFSIIFTNFLYFSFSAFLFENMDNWERILGYLIIIAGLIYGWFGYKIRKTSFKDFGKGFYNIGALFILSASMYLGGFRAFLHVGPEIRISQMLWEVAFPFIIFIFIYLSVVLKYNHFFDLGVVFFMGYIIKITAAYFSDSLGWPLALVIMGLLMILVVYLGVNFRKKYLK